MTVAWSTPTSSEAVARRAGGRRHYNAWRQHLALYRRFKISRLLFVKGGFLQRGFQACLARKLGVSRRNVNEQN